MAVEKSRVDTVAAALAEQIDVDHGEHEGAQVRTVGLLVTVGYDDPETGERRTATHYRFADGADDDCPNYVALGLLQQVSNDLA